MTEQEARIEQLEKEVEIIKKRLDYFFETIRPDIIRNNCRNKFVVADDNNHGRVCYELIDCLKCKYLKRSNEG